MSGDIQIGDWVRAETEDGVVESQVCFVVEQDGMVVLTNTHVQSEDVIEVRDGEVEARRAFYDDIEGVTDREERVYADRVEKLEKQFGQGSVGDSVRNAISVLEPVWTTTDLIELSGASQNVVNRVVRKEQIRNTVKEVGKARTNGRPKTIYRTTTGGKR